MSQRHTALVNRILMRFSARPGLTLWKMPTGVARALTGGQIISYGVEGGTNIMGIMAPAGRTVAIEVKVGDDRLRKKQRDFREMILSHGGLHIVAYSEEDVERGLDQ